MHCLFGCGDCNSGHVVDSGFDRITEDSVSLPSDFRWPGCIVEGEDLVPFNKEKFTDLVKQTGGQLKLDEIISVPKFICRNSTEEFLNCPNLPEHHTEVVRVNKDDYENDYLSFIGYYYWIDVEIFDAFKESHRFRVVFNQGDADCNDGIWGAAYVRESGLKVLDFISSGDCHSTLATVAEYDSFSKFHSHIVENPFDGNCGLGTFDFAVGDELAQLMSVALVCFYNSLEFK